MHRQTTVLYDLVNTLRFQNIKPQFYLSWHKAQPQSAGELSYKRHTILNNRALKYLQDIESSL